MLRLLRSKKEFVLFLKGKSYRVETSHEHYDKVSKMIDEGATEDELLLLLDAKVKVESMLSEISTSDAQIELNEFDDVVYNGDTLPGEAGTHIKELSTVENSSESYGKFVARLKKNSDAEVVKDLYSFIGKGKMPITDDGCFVAYRVCTYDFKDKHTKTFDNSIGATVTMPRDRCDSNRSNTCSSGLHFCSQSYISGFKSSSDRLLMVKIDPADVVAIPSDYNDAKGRCCKFIVVKEIEEGDITGFGVVNTTNSEGSVTSQNDVKNQKTCTCCKKTLPYDSFSKKASSKDGFNTQCKACVKDKRNGSDSNLANTKKCSCCGKNLPLDSFSKRSDSKDGLNGQCKECIKAKKKK